MRRFLVYAIAVVLSVAAGAQGPVIHGSGDPRTLNPFPNCGFSRFYVDDSTQKLYIANGGSPCVWSDSSSPLPNITTAGLVAEYSFTEGTLRDLSGNGMDAVMGASAPTFTAAGLSFTQSSKQYVSLPAALNSAHTFQFMMYVNPINVSNFPGFAQASFFGSSVSNAGNNFWLGNNAAGDNLSGIVATGKNNVTNNTVAQQSATGLHLVTIVLGSVNDLIYIDGQQATYTATTGTYGAQTTAGGNFQIGTTVQFSANTYSFNGTILFAAIYSGSLTTGQIVKNYQTISRYISTKDLSSLTLPTVSYSATNELVTDGDSLSYGLNGTAYYTLLSLNQTWTTINTGVPSFTPLDNYWQATLSVDPLLAKAASQNAVLIWSGTNGATSSPNTIANYGWLVSYCQQRRAQGWKVFVLTMISRTGEDTFKNQLNALIRQNWRQFADYLVDVAANANIGADGANTNSTYFNVDNIHLKTAGDTLVAAMASNAVNAYYGNTDSTPTVTTSNAYTEVAADNFVLQTPSGAATNTLIDCTGLTGSIRTIANGSGANAITVSGASGQTINGSATVAANATGRFLDVLTGPTTGGCSWQRIQ